MPKIFNNILDAIGATPLVRLNKVVPKSVAATVLAKCEFMNPAGSIKDRMARYIIEQAEKSGELKPGGIIIENTSGNTGLGLAMVAAVKGYRTIFTMPDKVSKEKIDSLKGFGAEVVIARTEALGDSPDHYVNIAIRLAATTPGAFYVNQYHSQHNPDAHYYSTGPEIWEQCGGQIDCFVVGLGTGGTSSGTARFLKEKKPGIKIIGVDPIGSVHQSMFKTGKPDEPAHYKVEGLGEDIPCRATDYTVLDDVVKVNDQQCFSMARRLVKEEGLWCGGSSGGLVDIAITEAAKLGHGKTVITVLPDSGARYVSKFLSDKWMQDNGFAI